MSDLTHFDDKGEAHMVDVSDKQITHRVAVAKGTITMAASTLELITEGRAKKVMFLVLRVWPALWRRRKHMI